MSTIYIGDQNNLAKELRLELDMTLEITTYVGDGSASRNISLPFTPKLVLVSASGVSPVTADPSSPAIVKNYFAMAITNNPGPGVTINADNTITVNNDADSVMAESRRKLNAPSVTYIVAAFK